MRILLANLAKMVGDSGGLAKVACRFANEMERRGHQVSILHSDEKLGAFFYPVSKSINCYNLKTKPDGSIIKMPVYLILLREIYRIFSKTGARVFTSKFMEKYLLDNMKHYVSISDPEIIIAFQAATSKLLLCDNDVKIPVITMFHGTPEDPFNKNLPEELTALAKSAVCQVLLPPFALQLKELVPEIRTVVIGNVVPQFVECADLSREKNIYKIIFVGALNKARKRQHLLVQAFALLAAKYPDWVLELWGAATSKAYLKELQFMIARSNLKDRILIKGVTSDIPKVLAGADIFAFPSASEGFSLALTEAMSMGLPVVGSKNCISTSCLINDGENGLLHDDSPDAIALTLEKLIENRELRIRLGTKARESVKRFAPGNIWDQWETLMQKLSHKSVIKTGTADQVS